MGNGTSSARSTGVTLDNDTPYTLYRDGYHLSHGSWTDYAPKEIPPHESRKWMSESDGFMTGTEGYVYYKVNGERFKVHWNNPYAGGNSYYYTTPTGDFTVSYNASTGDNCYVRFKIKAPEIQIKTRYWSPKLKDYDVSTMLWYYKPLESATSTFGAKHSWIRVKLDLNTKNKPISSKYEIYETKGQSTFEFIVERHKGGIYISSANYRSGSERYKKADKSYQLKDINLRSLLVRCCQQNGGYYKYHVKTKNCHHFAYNIWCMCTNVAIHELINKWLAKLGGIVWSQSSATNKRTGLERLDPRNEKDEDIFKRLQPYAK